MSEVGGNGVSAAPGRADPFGDGVQLRLRARRDQDIGTCLGKSERDGRAEAAAAAGDDGDFVVETEPVKDHCGLSMCVVGETVANGTAGDRGISETGSSLAY